MDVPEEVWAAFKLLKRGFSSSRILRRSARDAYAKHAPSWQRRFAKRYVEAINRILEGNSLDHFLRALNVPIPNLSGVWLGRKGLRFS